MKTQTESTVKPRHCQISKEIWEKKSATTTKEDRNKQVQKVCGRSVGGTYAGFYAKLQAFRVNAEGGCWCIQDEFLM